MAKTKISEFDTNADNNTDINNINIAEGCAPSGINNAIRQLMADLKEWQSGAGDYYIAPAGTASTPAFTKTGDTNTGIFFPAADTIAFTEGGVESMRITSDGRLLIGTSTTPSGSGTTQVISATNGGLLVYSTAQTGGFALSSAVTGGGLAINTVTGAIGSETYTERMRITSAGNVGIGADPQTKFMVYDATSTRPYFVGDSTVQIISQRSSTDATSSIFSFRKTRGTQASPTAVATADNAGVIEFTAYGGTNYRAVASILANVSDYTSDTNMSGVLTFSTTNAGTAPTERMRITSTGNVGIGESSPDTRLHIYGASTAGRGQLYIQGSSTVSRFTLANSSDSYALNTYGDSSTSLLTWDTNSGYSFRWTVADTERMRITSGGEVYIAGTTDQGAYNLQVNGTGVWGAGAYVNGSDERIKDDIATLDSGLDVVTKLNPVTYKYKEDWSKDQSTQTGFIAQELLTALEGKNYVDGVVQQGGEYMSVAYQNIIPILTKAIQEQQAMIEELKQEVAALKAK